MIVKQPDQQKWYDVYDYAPSWSTDKTSGGIIYNSGIGLKVGRKFNAMYNFKVEVIGGAN